MTPHPFPRFKKQSFSWKREGPKQKNLLSSCCWGAAPLALLLFASILPSFLTGCLSLEPAPPPPHVIAIYVTSDPGIPVAGADLLLQGKPIAKTDAKGIAKLALRGTEGQNVDIQISCPASFTSPTQPLQITLFRLIDPLKIPQYDARCLPRKRTIVVIVRAENGPNLPILHLNREIGRTDTNGVNHVLVRMKPNDEFLLTLSTQEKGNEGLHPQNPKATFRVKDQDDIFVFDVKFTTSPAPRHHVHRKKAPKGPIKLNSLSHKEKRYPKESYGFRIASARNACY
ncbi:hypothetical protein BCY86_07405 [Pajaroellobacter abortibovis]|uniref:Uncharacterized protein n=2 Tax=Pajaroellobacter abortibovis TaxID=1882918 RepID=A0A1L6MYD2_9BACT|nr:hypothetical protein BCY86_07405 [Pajaroellobacter abortibovis]